MSRWAIWRHRQHARLERIINYEYWPVWLFYAPLFPYLGYLSLRFGGFHTPTAANPGIEHAGGFVGESKYKIMRGLGEGPHVLPTALIPAGPAEQRLAAMHSAARDHPTLGRWPLILKPDEGQRGFAVKLVRSVDEAAAYFREMTGDAVVQPFDPGPHECGVLWVRGIPGRGDGSRPGSIFSITRKDFPTVTGDGERTLPELVATHPRHRRQAGTFMERFGDRAGWVPGAGEVVRLGLCGNHCQGALFRDGEDLITPALTDAINGLALGFRGEGGGELDFGRFDIRYESDGELREGRDFRVVELNGTASESTNMYDPDWSVWRAYRTLFSQWRQLYELGAWRRTGGHPTATVREVLGWLREHKQRRTGSRVSD